MLTDAVRSTYTITVLLSLIVLLLLRELRGTGFLHFGPGTTPANTTKFINMPIDSWKRWCFVVIVSTVYALLVAWRSNVALNFQTQMVKARKVDYATYCGELGVSRGRECERTTTRFAALDAINKNLLQVLPIFLYSTHQLQYMAPSIFIGITISTWGTMHFFRKKDGFRSA